MVLNWVLAGVRRRPKRKGARPKPDYETAKRVAASPDMPARADLAACEELEPEFLYYLASDEAPEVRRAVAVNEATPLQADRILADDADDEVRCELARKIGRLAPTLSADEKDRLSRMALEVLEILARDDLPRVRATIAEEIKKARNVPKPIVDRLARDVEEIVAAPILEYSPLLSEDELVEIIAGGAPEGALVALARRKKLGRRASAAVAETRHVDAVAALLANKSANLSDKTLDMVAVESEGVVEWHAPMVDRDNLPARVVRRIATFVSAALLDALIEKNAAQAGVVDELRRTVRQRIERGDFAEEESRSGWESAEDRVRKALAAGTLDERMITQAIEDGDNAFVRYGLVGLSRMPLSTVSKLLNTGGGKGVVALAWKAGLSMRGAELLQRRVARLTPQQMLLARNDGQYPLGEDDLEWYLSCLAG